MCRVVFQILVLCLILLMFPLTVSSGVTFTSDITLVSRYIWRGFDTIIDDHPAIQPSLTLAFGKSGLWFNAWSAFALADTDFVELDLIVGYDRVLSDDVAISAGVGYFTFPSMSGFPDENSTTPEAYAGVTLSSLPLSPNLTVYYDFNLGDGVYATFSLSRDFQFERKAIHSSILVGYTEQYQDIGVDPGFSDICFGLSTDFGVRGLTLTPSLNYVVVPNETINDEDEFWMGLTVSWSTD